MPPGSVKILFESRYWDSNRKNTGPVAGTGATAFTKPFLHKQQLHVPYRLILILVFSLPSGKWSSPVINGQPPLPCDSFTLTPVGERRAALFGGRSVGLTISNLFGGVSVSDLFIVDLSRHTVVSGECYKPGSHAILTQELVT